MPHCITRARSRARRHDAQVIDAMASAPIFATLSLRRIADIVDRFEEQKYRAGSRVVLEGRTGSDFFLILDGEATVTFERWPVLHLSRGDGFGEVGVLGGGSRIASVTALTPLRCLVLANGELEQLIRDEPQLGINLLRALITRFHALNGAWPAWRGAPIPL